MKPHALMAALLAQALVFGSAHGASIKICADVPDEFAPDNKQVINTQGAQKPTDANVKALVSEQNKVKALLQCKSEGVGLGSLVPAESAQLSSFDELVLNKAKKNEIPTESLVRAVFMASLVKSGQRLSGANTSTETWQIDQARSWCKKNDASVDQTAKVPKLLSLEEGVNALDANAITYAWRVVSKFPSKKLGQGCTQAVQAFKTKVSGTSPEKQ